MATLVTPTRISTAKRFNKLPADCLTRDQSQSDLLHEPRFRISNIDPMSGEDVTDVSSHPSLIDGNLTMYFQTEETRKDYIRMPMNHPSLHLSFAPTVGDDRGG
jgi:hypothetical protein